MAELKSFSKAAAHLNVSKSLLSRQISSLEAELQVRLLQRTTRSLTLTEAGLGYYKDVSKILSQLQEADASLTELQSSPRGRLRVSAPMTFGVLHLASALPEFLRAYPNIEIDIVLNDRVVDLVEEGFDVAIRIGRLLDSNLVAKKLTSTRRTICASPDYVRRAGAPSRPEDLHLFDCLCYSNLAATDEWRFQRGAADLFSVEVKGRFHANNGDILRLAALEGLGFANLPTFIVGKDLQAGTLISVLTDYIPQDAGVYALYPQSRYLSPKVRVFVDFLASRFGPKPQWDLVH